MQQIVDEKHPFEYREGYTVPKDAAFIPAVWKFLEYKFMGVAFYSFEYQKGADLTCTNTACHADMSHVGNDAKFILDQVRWPNCNRVGRTPDLDAVNKELEWIFSTDTSNPWRAACENLVIFKKDGRIVGVMHPHPQKEKYKKLFTNLLIAARQYTEYPVDRIFAHKKAGLPNHIALMWQDLPPDNTQQMSAYNPGMRGHSPFPHNELMGAYFALTPFPAGENVYNNYCNKVWAGPTKLRYNKEIFDAFVKKEEAPVPVIKKKRTDIVKKLV